MGQPDWRKAVAQYRILVALLILALILLVVLTAPPAFMTLLGVWGETVKSIAPELLAAVMVSLLFDWLARREVLEYVDKRLADNEERVIRGVLAGEMLPEPGEPLLDLWNPFVTQPSHIVVAGDTTDRNAAGQPEWVVRTADIQAAWKIYRQLLKQFLPLCSYSEVKLDLDVIAKTSLCEDDLPAGNLIVIGGPSSNPLTRKLMELLHSRYLFLVDKAGAYNANAFVQFAAPDKVGIYERVGERRPETGRAQARRKAWRSA